MENPTSIMSVIFDNQKCVENSLGHSGSLFVFSKAEHYFVVFYKQNIQVHVYIVYIGRDDW